MWSGPRSELLAWVVAGAALLAALGATAGAEPGQALPAWTSENRVRLRLRVAGKERQRSHSPAWVVIDFAAALRAAGVAGSFDEATVVVAAMPATGEAGTADVPRKRVGGVAVRLPHRIDSLFGSSRAVLSFVVPDETCKDFAVYFDTADSGRGEPRRPRGLIGDGDFFREEFQRREIAASHFDQFVDFDGDGDLDLFKGGVEPFVYCYENAGGNRLVERGRLASLGEPLTLPSSRARRSWVSVSFFDLDEDGDQDFFPSFNDGPDSGQFVFYRNVTRERGAGPPGDTARLAFERVGPLRTVSGVPLAGGAEAGGWFPSITFVRGWERKEGGTAAALVGSKNRCWLYHGLGPGADGSPRFEDAVAVRAGGREIELVNPRFDCADVDGDGDLDLFAGTQPGPVLFFRNDGSSDRAELAAGLTVAFGGKYLIGDAHSGLKVADFDGDGLADLAAGRFWERTDLDRPDAPRDFGGFWRNAGTGASPRFERSRDGAPHTEGFQICDAIRQNCVRAVDWDGDGRLDLLAGDTDGFVWFFGGEGERAFPVFQADRKLRAGEAPLSLATAGGHARFDVCDWQNDGRRDLLVAGGGGTVTLFLNQGTPATPALDAGRRLEAGGEPVQVGGRASALVCDWDGDGQKDLVLADDKGYWFLRNGGPDAAPALAAPRPILFGGKAVTYVRPNLGSFVDWDGDGKRDLIGCHFENSIRLYRNIGSGAPGTEPEFADPEGTVILQASSPQMISGVDVLDWNGDGDLDLLTGQGHGGSGLRFFERDWIEDELHDSHPLVTVQAVEAKPKAPPR